MQRYDTSSILTLTSTAAGPNPDSGANAVGTNGDVEFIVEPMSESFVRFDEVDLRVVSMSLRKKTVAALPECIYVTADLHQRKTKNISEGHGANVTGKSILTGCVAILHRQWSDSPDYITDGPQWTVATASPFGRSIRIRLTDHLGKPMAATSTSVESYEPWTLVLEVTPKLQKPDSNAMSM